LFKKTTKQSGRKPEAQVIAEAIATFQYNNGKRIDLNLEPLESMDIPCITMVGTRPVFYKVPVTQQLSDAVATGQYPHQPTIVSCCAPPAKRRASEGMETPDYRKIALQYYDAFRHLAKSFWSSFTDGCLRGMLVDYCGHKSDGLSGLTKMKWLFTSFVE
jgi:hypothetical protein